VRTNARVKPLTRQRHHLRAQAARPGA
jgi:hypothetical protein